MADSTQQALEAMNDTVASLCARFAAMMSSPNQSGSNNNCVYLTIAHLLNKTLDDYLTQTEQMQPNNAEDEPTLEKVAQMLSETGKQIFTYNVDNPVEFLFRTYADNSPIPMWGVLFRREDGSGHCVVYEHGDFRDYQTDPVETIEGEAATRIETQIVYVFSISEQDVTKAPPEESGEGDREIPPQDVEMNEDTDMNEPTEGGQDGNPAAEDTAETQTEQQEEQPMIVDDEPVVEDQTAETPAEEPEAPQEQKEDEEMADGTIQA